MQSYLFLPIQVSHERRFTSQSVIGVPDYSDSPTTRKVLRLSAKTLAAGTAWARVEAGKHYPTDVLAGAAIGHFLTAVIHDSFMGLGEAVQLDVRVDRREGAMLSLSWPL